MYCTALVRESVKGHHAVILEILHYWIGQILIKSNNVLCGNNCGSMNSREVLLFD